ncbi:N-methylhydantoinase B [Rhodococcus aetherivorans]|uniref:N-methylhydantoinase B n=1 Tax=Rhodococcus aetherivorans TaxID=191292 RepID=A0ABQ0YFD5_9NOCA|nr:hydantoinase B/oxoprolinase family protein [Rhodococcus aetherivorans]ETT25637.1 5-oxoprolinase (ATP-hydrolyzing) [Rhodococcus rhodochrous ATCC 21198]NGP26181.1 hydantoinase B/oxoprolinase family protein [Rhodococcus aetherivorans]GES35236.1 N-methylhydantoinase B [Rhodococcus aetherivorans]
MTTLERPTAGTAGGTAIDPILASVLQRRVDAIAKEMATMLMRSSRSPIFNEIGDLVTVLFDKHGRTLAQAEFAAIIAFGAQPPLEYIIDYFGDDIAEGDVILHNDVYTGGNQNADTGVYLPIFHEGELVGWAAAKGHMADIGGMTIGGYNPSATEIWQEALRIPPVKIMAGGVLRKDVWDFVGANIRIDFVMEDIKSMVGACTVGSRRLVELLGRYGRGTFDAHMDYILDSSEKQVRAEIGRWPDGVYHGESWMISDGLDPTRRYEVACDITVSGDEVTFDFSRTDDQAPGITNMPPASAMGAVRIAFLMLVAAGGINIPTNDGLFRPVHTVFRPGSLLNPHFPAATIFGNQMCDEVVDAIMSALADALPDRVTAGWNKFICTALNGTDPRTEQPFVTLTVFQRNGPGAMKGTDGWDALGFTGTAGQMRSPDPEMFELSSPHFLEYHEYLPDSAGAGQWRGGLGTRSAWRCYGDSEIGVTIGESVESEGGAPGAGLFGGGPSGMNRMTVEYPDGTTHEWGSKELVELPSGSVVRSVSGGGAGYGDPLLRPADLVADEVRNELLSAEQARIRYGVVVDAATRTLDAEATAQLRNTRKGGQ